MNKIKKSAYIIAVIINNLFANLTFILLSFFTEYSLLWVLTSVVFVIIAFTPIGAGDTEKSVDNLKKSKTKNKIVIISYLVFLLTLSIFYIVISLLVNNLSWVFIIVIFLINSIYLINYTKEDNKNI